MGCEHGFPVPINTSGRFLCKDCELTSLRAEVEEGIKIVMSIIGNGLLNEPEFSSILKRARAFAKLDAGKEGKL